MLAGQLILTAGNTIQAVKLVQTSNKNVTYFKQLNQLISLQMNGHVSTALNCILNEQKQ